MNIELEALLHPRVSKHCNKLYTDGHYKHAAFEAMTQVELALKEISGVRNKYGVNLITGILGEGKGIKLRVPFGEELQKQAEALFRGAFTYYRNYAAHDGSRIDNKTCLRVMILASELLDLIGASTLSFADVGGIAGLVKTEVFPNENGLFELLCLLDGNTLPDEAVDGFYEDLEERGFTEAQVHALIDIGLVEYLSDYYCVPIELAHERDTLPTTVGWFELTELGERVVKDLEKTAQ